MLERLRRSGNDDGGTATRERAARSEGVVDERPVAASAGTATPVGRERGVRADDVRSMRSRQREEFGGVNWGAAFFGWLTALGLAAILTGLAAAAGAALGLADADAETIGLGGAIALVVALAIAYFAGGYVAGRMSRFDGGRQGAATWVVALVATLLLGGLAAIGGAEYNVLERVDLPRIPVDEGTLTTAGIVTLAATVLATLLAAMLGGKAGERYHRRVDRAALSER